ncbi:MAG: O-antigen ligase family protein [Burkholderiaceae bacterium]|nr:O-antigen ligase family protein [Burkholderiaceae bacterium]
MSSAADACRDWLWRQGSSLAAFLLPGAALWLPSGYSWGALWLLLCALVCVRGWWRLRPDPATGWLALLIALMALLWGIDTGPHPGMAAPETALKYLAALPCLLFAVAAPPRPSALWAGLAAGGIGSGALALVQRYGLHLDRAHGLTNPVQYGDLSLLLGLMALGALALLWSARSPAWRFLLGAGGLLGLLGSLLSQTRGGWLALLLAAPVAGAALARRGYAAQAGKLALALMAALLLTWPLVHTELTERLARIGAEVHAYDAQRDAGTSIGQRLEHWRLAAHMGAARPLLGWGSAYMEEKARRVAAGQARPGVLEYTHAHNELLDMFARRGLIGVALLLLYLLAPLALFWPTPARIRAADGSADPVRLALCLTGILLPLAYLGFGLTQVFFAHNSGHLFYLFMLILVHAALRAGKIPHG